MDNETREGQLPGTAVGQVPMERLHSIFDGMFDGVWLVAADGRTTYANGAMARLLGSTASAMRGRPVTDFLDEALWPGIEDFLTRQQTHAGERIEITLRRVDGSDLYGLMAGSPITTRDDVFVGTMLNVSDVTGKRSLDAQVVQNQRLEAIGQFAGGVAHDFNNLLTSIQGFTELARAGMGEDDPVRRDLDRVLVSSAKAGAITRKLLAFTRRQVLAPVDVDPAQVIAELIPILEPLLGDDIAVVLDVEADHAWIRVDPTQLEQVLVNLATNARDAMPTGGTLTIAVGNLPALDPARPDPDLNSVALVRISVRDTGTGMDEATRSRIFDPFFSTKGPGKGSGLGLSTVFGIVSQSGGRVEVETTLGGGATFHIDLPRSDVAPATPEEVAADSPVSRTGVVLLVEDEPAVRDFAQISLERAGYVVLPANGADQALRASQRWPEAIDVLLTDIVMPGVHGPELAARIRAERPGIGVVFTSGYAEDAVASAGEIGEPGEFLPKPFSVDSLRRVVGRAAASVRHEPPAPWSS